MDGRYLQPLVTITDVFIDYITIVSVNEFRNSISFEQKLEHGHEGDMENFNFVLDCLRAEELLPARRVMMLFYVRKFAFVVCNEPG